MAISERTEIRALRHLGDQRYHLVQRVRVDPEHRRTLRSKTAKFQSWAIPGGGNIVRNTSVTPDGNFLLANSLVNGITLVKIKK